MTSQPPRFFIASRHDPEVTHDPGRGEQPLAHVIDTFLLEPPGAQPMDLVVGVDATGQLALTGANDSARLTESACAQLHVHELTHSSKRVIAAEELSLFTLELVEHISNPTDLNDPVCLYGTLHLLTREGAHARALRGQLTITRGDFLQGFVNARHWAFRYGSQLANEPVCQHALVPAARAEDIARGCGMVLIYPLPPREVADDDMDNGAIVAMLLGDALTALRLDLERQEAERGPLAKWFSGSRAKLLEYPPDASSDSLFERATAALRLLPDWPNARSLELFKRVRTAGTPPPSTMPASRSPSVPHLPKSSAPAPLPTSVHAPSRYTIPPRQSSLPPDWMQDFLRDHRGPGTRVQYSTVARQPSKRAAPRTGPKTGAGTPEWMSDFGEAPKTQPSSEKPQEKPDAPRPDWMDDFEDK